MELYKYRCIGMKVIVLQCRSDTSAGFDTHTLEKELNTNVYVM